MKEWLTKKMTRPNLEKFIARHASQKRTLDLGSKKGPYARYFPNRVAMDVEHGEGVDIVGDAHSMPFKDGEFDVVLCTEVLEHLHTPEKAIAEMYRVLKINGTLILSTRFLFPIHDAPSDYYRFTKYGLRHLFRDWEIVELIEEVNTKDTIAVLLQRIGYQTRMRGGAFTKALVFLLAKFVKWFPSCIDKEYGDIRKSREEDTIMTSGYYLLCRRRL